MIRQSPFIVIVIAIVFVVGLAACGPQYAVSTCSFLPEEDGCEPVEMPDMPQPVIATSMSLIDPRASEVEGCTADVSVEVNSGEHSGAFAWSAQEQTRECEPIGDPMEGEEPLGGTLTEDIYFPTWDFTFRIQVEEAG